MRLSAILVVCLALALACFGCSEDEPTQPPPPPSGTIAVAPPAASVFVHSSQAFVATTGDTADHSVTWRLRRDPALSDTLDVGTIVATGPKTVTYTAPATVENLLGYSLTLLAVSDRDTTVGARPRSSCPRCRWPWCPITCSAFCPPLGFLSMCSSATRRTRDSRWR